MIPTVRSSSPIPSTCPLGSPNGKAERLVQRQLSAVIVAAAAPTVASLAFGATGVLAVALTLTGLCGSVAAARAVRDGVATPPVLWWAVAAVAVIAVVRSPIGSHDLWSYAFYGRMWSHYGVNPYNAVPAQFSHDVLDPLVRWRHTPSGYGPLFTLYSAGATRVAGNSVVAMRLFFQGAAAVSVLGCLGVLHRARHTRTLVLVALAPFVWVALVNGGHNDALVAAGVLAAVVAFDKERWLLAGVLVAVAGMIKLPGLFVAVPFVAVLLTRRRWRDAAVLAAGPAIAVVACLLLLPASLENASGATSDRISRASIWRPVQLLTGAQAPMLTAFSVALVLAVIALIVWTRRRDSDVSLSAGSSLAAFGFGASYTLTWYQFWGLPAIALSGDLAATTILATRGSLMQASYQLTGSGVPATVAAIVLSAISPIVLFALFLRRVTAPRSTPEATTLDTVPSTQRGGTGRGRAAVVDHRG